MRCRRSKGVVVLLESAAQRAYVFGNIEKSPGRGFKSRPLHYMRGGSSEGERATDYEEPGLHFLCGPGFLFFVLNETQNCVDLSWIRAGGR